MLAIASVFALLLIFAPVVAWSFPVFRNCGFKFLDNMIWWLAGMQAAALLALWLGRFDLPYFLCVFLVLMVMTTMIRFRMSGDSPGVDDLAWAEAFLASLVIAAVWVPANVYADVPRRIDALIYHLPMAAQWVQTGSMMATDCGVWFYPGGYELMTAVLFLVGKSDLLWFVPDLVSWTLLVVSTYGLLCLLGVNRNAAALIVGTLVLSPVVRSQLTKGNNDLLVAALAVGAVAALGRRVDKGSRQARAAGLVCLGAMVGTKYAAFPLMLILVPFVVFQRRQSARPFGRLEVLAVVVAGILLVSFPLRNILVTGNPVFPVGVWGLFPWGDTSHVSPGVPAISPEQLTATSLAHQPPAIWRIFLKQVWHWAAFLPVLAVMALVLRLFKKWSWSLGRVDGLALTTALLSFAAFVTQPLVVGNHPGSIHQIASGTSLRFGLVWIILLAVWLFAKIPDRFSLPTAAVLFVATLVINHLLQFAVVILAANLVLCLLGRVAGPRRIFAGLLVPVALVAVNLNADHARPVQEANAYTAAYLARGDSGIAQHIRDKSGSRVIILSGGLRAWPLIGHDLKNRVVQVGMSRPAEEFVRQADIHDAGMIIVPKSIGHDGWPYPAQPFAEMERVGSLLGQEWSVDYEDSLVIAFARDI